MRKHTDGVWQAAHRDFQWDRDLPLYLFRSLTGIKGDNCYLDVRYVRKSFDRQRTERSHARADEDHRNKQQKQWLVKSEAYNSLDHRRPSSSERTSNTPRDTTWSPATTPCVTRSRPPFS